jgi:hypothetical protein
MGVDVPTCTQSFLEKNTQKTIILSVRKLESYRDNKMSKQQPRKDANTSLSALCTRAKLCCPYISYICAAKPGVG